MVPSPRRRSETEDWQGPDKGEDRLAERDLRPGGMGPEGGRVGESLRAKLAKLFPEDEKQEEVPAALSEGHFCWSDVLQAEVQREGFVGLR